MISSQLGPIFQQQTLGFTNITKLTKWTPGCATNDAAANINQFYHW